VVIAFYVSGHGFGHASRDVEVMHAIAEERPDARLVVRTAVPPGFFEVSARVPLDVQPAVTDSGLVQRDSVRFDEQATARAAREFYGSFDERVTSEAHLLSHLAPDIVVGDVPPLAFAAAQRAGVPSLLLANFTWDWIYESVPAIASSDVPVIGIMREAYATASGALRLPFHGGFESLRGRITDIPLIARRSSFGRVDARARLGIDPRRTVVLSSFGRYGMALPCDRIAGGGEFLLLVTELELDESGGHSPAIRHLRRDEWMRLGLRYEDLVAAADVVVSKPGYGIVSECIANGTALLYLPRERFVEQDVLVRDMPRFLRCRPFSIREFESGRWSGPVQALLEQPPPTGRLDLGGARAAAAAILSTAERRTWATSPAGLS
jgi:L-arabinokinase